MKEILLVCIGSFFGGGARFLVSKALQSFVTLSLPWGTHGCQRVGLLPHWITIGMGTKRTTLAYRKTGAGDGLLRRLYDILHIHERKPSPQPRGRAPRGCVVHAGKHDARSACCGIGLPDSQIMMLDKLFYDKHIECVFSCKGYSTFTDEIPRTC